jgi:ABC-type uncharacterized transport system involved in gliding motility auxiliary subunit
MNGGLSRPVLKRVLLLVAAVALVIAAIIALVYGAGDRRALVLAIAAVVALGLYVALFPGEVFSGITSRRTLYGGNTAVLVAAVLGLLVLVNLVAARHARRWDLTANHAFSLSDQTINVLHQLPGPVKATSFLTSDDPRRQDLVDRFKEYQARSDGKFEYEFVDPEAEPARAVALGVRTTGTTVLQMADRTQQVSGTSESDITGGLVKLILPPRKVYFTTGHGERQLDSASENGYSALKSALDHANITVDTVTLAGSHAVPDDAAAVVIAGPQRPFLEEEISALNDYLDRGGKMILLVDPQTTTNVGDVVKRWNIEIGSGVVFDTQSYLSVRGRGDPSVPVVSKYTASPITKDLPLTFFPVSTYITVPQTAPQNATIRSLAETSARSWATSDLQNPDYQEGRDQKGPLSLVVSVEADAQNAPADSTGSDDAPLPGKTRVVIFGDSQIVTNQALALASGNQDLFLNSLNWVIGSDQLVSIRPTTPDDRSMLLTQTQMNLMLVLTTVVMPLIVLGGGLVVWWRRR